MKSLEEIKFEEFSVAVPAMLNSVLCKHLLREDHQEDATFALYKPSRGKLRFTGLIYRVVLPEKGDREVHGNVEINSQYFKRVCKLAAAENAGVVLLHSHLGPGWQGMSTDDFVTERSYAVNTESLTDLPLIGCTLGTDGALSARIWEENNGWYEKRWAVTVRVVGQKLSVTYHDGLRPRPAFKEVYKRTVTVWGSENHAHLARLKIGIIGLGSVGSIVAESLARMGVERFVLMDFDEVQEHNLDRLLGATFQDIGHSKVSVAHRQILKASTATNPQVTLVTQAITEKEGYLPALDCDVLFSCVDRPWPRQILNHIAYNHLIPVIDGGIQVRLSLTGEFEGADWQLQTVGPDRPCLQCLGAFNPADVATEQAGLLEDPSYLAGLPMDHNFKRNENIFPFSANLASLEVLQFIEMVTGIGGTDYYGTQRYTYNQGYVRLNDSLKCKEGCLYQANVALGDSLFSGSYGIDHSAINARTRQE
ncbi:MAG: ThiF family adenylyltransferase [Sphingobacteriaceae bacterium]|nr:MAG: ThiF family adenylyltransferase [Sphingobacteriaceae bacterium]